MAAETTKPSRRNNRGNSLDNRRGGSISLSRSPRKVRPERPRCHRRARSPSDNEPQNRRPCSPPARRRSSLSRSQSPIRRKAEPRIRPSPHYAERSEAPAPPTKRERASSLCRSPPPKLERRSPPRRKDGRRPPPRDSSPWRSKREPRRRSSSPNKRRRTDRDRESRVILDKGAENATPASAASVDSGVAEVKMEDLEDYAKTKITKITAEVVGRTGGIYIPPFKLAQLQKAATDRSSTEYQRQSWEALRKSINGLVNKVNVGNITNLIQVSRIN